MQITAILCIRNEEPYLEVTLAHLAACDIHLAIIDNESTDETLQICRKFRRRIIYQSRLPYRGVFSLTDQLAAKAEVVRQVRSDWFIHQDADEILESPQLAESLRDGIERVSASGFNVINFNEFVFVPATAQDRFERRDFYDKMRHYYFFEPIPRRLMRAWQNRPGVVQLSGGHYVDGPDIRLCPENFILRHYPSLSLEHARNKYPLRRFAPEDLAKGWHGNRLGVRADSVAFPAPNQLKALRSAGDKNFDCGEPWQKHYWENGGITNDVPGRRAA
ncbi:MAG: glycosyltransferase family 2 protein [Thermoguttaceae bacterium]|jgi:glycosyltransferase involved in cell wall biosynthesis